MSDYYKQWRAKVIQDLGGVCVWCGATNHLQIDHINPAQKRVSVSNIWSYCSEIVEEELAKCQLLCEICHKGKHAATHGTYSRYRHHKCRCNPCREAGNRYMRDYKKKRRSRSWSRQSRFESSSRSQSSDLRGMAAHDESDITQPRARPAPPVGRMRAK